MRFGFTLSGRRRTEGDEPTASQTTILKALQDRHVYEGTANRNRIAARRRKNKMARKSRKNNRG